MIAYLAFFYGYLGKRVLVALALSLVVAVLDGFGLAMFLPLLDAGGAAGGEQMNVVIRTLRAVGISGDLVSVLLVLLTFFVLKGVAKFCLDYCRAQLQERFMRGLRLEVLHLLTDCDYGQFTHAHAGRIQNILSGEIARLNQAYGNYFQLLQQLIMASVYAVLACSINPRFGVIVLVGGLLSNLTFHWINRATKRTSRQLSVQTNEYQGYLVQLVASFKFLKATNLIQAYRRKITSTVIEVERKWRRIGLLNAAASASREPLIILIVVTAIIIQVVVFGQPLAILLLSILLFYRALTSVLTAQNSYNLFLGVSGSVESVKNFIKEIGQAREVGGTEPFVGLRDGITVTNLSYGYGSVSVLRKLSFRIDKFTTIGIVGESGSGKTTLVNLLCSLLTAPRDTIAIDGTDITELDRASYRDRIGYVTQEAQVFTDTIRNNVTFWDGRADPADQRLLAALHTAHAADFVAALPDGLDTVVGINGLNLSGGQRQRLSIARELYRGVDLLIFDEATSSLDSKSEALIQQNIESLSGTLTLIVIAHRLSTLKKADSILFLHGGGGYEIGTFASLQAGSAKFRDLVALQLI